MVPRWSALMAAALQARRPMISFKWFTSFAWLRHVGGIGLVPLAVIDSTIIPTFGSLDLFTAVLAARTPDLWYYYALMSTVGATIGAAITYHMGRKLGQGWFEKKVGRKRFQRIGDAIHNWGFGAIFVACIAPPPYPTTWFFAGAGAFQVAQQKFFTAAVLGRALRYSLLTLVAAHYGRRFLRYLRHPTRYIVISLVVSAVLIAAVFFYGMWKRRSQRSGKRQN